MLGIRNWQDLLAGRECDVRGGAVGPHLQFEPAWLPVEDARPEVNRDVKTSVGHRNTVKAQRTADPRAIGLGIVERELQVVAACDFEAVVQKSPLISKRRAD